MELSSEQFRMQLTARVDELGAKIQDAPEYFPAHSSSAKAILGYDESKFLIVREVNAVSRDLLERYKMAIAAGIITKEGAEVNQVLTRPIFSATPDFLSRRWEWGKTSLQLNPALNTTFE